MVQITVVLNTFNRLQYVEEQINSVYIQTIKPVEIIVWNNSSQTLSVSPEYITTLGIPITVINASANMGVWARFFYAFNILQSEYIAFFDDDTIPGIKWFENCINSMKIKNGMYGTTGYRFNYNSYFNNERIGWLNGNDTIEEVDIIGHAWFLKRAWLKYMVNDLPNLVDFKLCGEDIHLSYTLRKYGDIRSFIPPHPIVDRLHPIVNKLELYGSTKGSIYGSDSAALSLQTGMDNKFETVYRYWVFKLNHYPILFEPIINNPEFVDHPKYMWSKMYGMIKNKHNFVYMQYINTNTNTDLLTLDKDPNIYYGIASTTNTNKFLTLYNTLKLSIHSVKNICYEDHFTLCYDLTREFIFEKLNKFIIISNYIDNNNLNVKKYVVVPDSIDSSIESSIDSCIDSIIKLASEYNDTVFIINTALSNNIISTMYKTNRNNTYIDIGTAFNIFNRIESKNNDDISINIDKEIEKENNKLIKIDDNIQIVSYTL